MVLSTVRNGLLTKQSVCDIQQNAGQGLLDLLLNPCTPFSLFSFCLHEDLKSSLAKPVLSCFFVAASGTYQATIFLS